MSSDQYNLNGIIPRQYQENIANEIQSRNTLLVLPTGLGKTIIAAMLAYKAIENGRSVIMVAPTRPLVDQHLKTFEELFRNTSWKIGGITGHTPKKERGDIWNGSRMVISTPQTVVGDIIRGYVDLEKYGLLVIDEAHRTIGNYSYVQIAKEFAEKSGGYILAMTASPGSRKEHIDQIKENLGIRKIIIRTEEDPDVSPYVMGSRITPVYIKPSEIQLEISRKLNIAKNMQILELSKQFPEVRANSTRVELTEHIRNLSSRAVNGEKHLFGKIPLFTACVRLDILCEYAETQGLELALDYMKEMMESEDRSIGKTINILMKNPVYVRAAEDLEKSMDNYKNNKFLKAVEYAENLVKKENGSKAIIFTHYRKTSQFLYDYIKSNSSILIPLKFIGQSSRKGDKGMSQVSQREGITKFRNGIYNLMLATSVAEEGLDIPSTDLVIFYEPVPSEIRSIQRRGRTGRFAVGDVYILIFEDGRDIAYYNSSRRKEYSMIGKMRKEMDVKTGRNLYEF